MIEDALNRIKRDYREEIDAAIKRGGIIKTFQDWIDYHPEILGLYTLDEMMERYDWSTVNEWIKK